MLENERPLSGLAVRKKLGELKGGKAIHAFTLAKAIRDSGLPCRPNPFGRGLIFYWSEIQAWLEKPSFQPDPVPAVRPYAAMAPVKRGPGRPRKAVCQ